MLTVEKLKKMKSGEIIASGFTKNSPDGIYLTSDNEGGIIQWVAIRGGIHDWAIYAQREIKDWTDNQVAQMGDKVIGERNIKKLVPCSDDAFSLYRY